MNERDHPSNPQTKNNNEKTKQSRNKNSTQQGPPTPATVNSMGNRSSTRDADCPELHNNAKKIKMPKVSEEMKTNLNTFHPP